MGDRVAALKNGTALSPVVSLLGPQLGVLLPCHHARRVLLHREELLRPQQLPEHRPPRHHGAAAGLRGDLRHHHRRHRPVRGVRDGPLRGSCLAAPCRVCTPRTGLPQRASWSGWAWEWRPPGLRRSSAGILVARYRVPPFIATLGTQGIAIGVTYHICGGFPVWYLPPGLTDIGNAYVLYIHPARGAWSFFNRPPGIAANQIKELVRLIPVSFILIIVLPARAVAPAEEHALRPAHLRHRREHGRRGARRHRHAAPPHPRSTCCPPLLAGVAGVRGLVPDRQRATSQPSARSWSCSPSRR